MITPNQPVVMYAAHDTTLETYSFPLATRGEMRLVRNAALAHLPLDERQRLFPVVPVLVTITPAPHHADADPRQAPLFPSEARP